VLLLLWHRGSFAGVMIVLGCCGTRLQSVKGCVDWGLVEGVAVRIWDIVIGW